MKLIITVIVCIVLSIAFSARPAKAEQLKVGDQVQSTDIVQLDDKAKDQVKEKDDEVKNPQDKEKRSKKNDDKDNDPDDGNAGGGNDNGNGQGHGSGNN